MGTILPKFETDPRLTPSPFTISERSCFFATISWINVARRVVDFWRDEVFRRDDRL